MSAHTEFDLGSLIWVKGEIDQALEKARQCLFKYKAQADTAELKFAQTHLHQVRGAVEMVGLAGAARFAEELEVAVGSIAGGEADPKLLGLVADAGDSLAQYLEALINGSPDLALKLLPAYRRVREARGEKHTSGADLFFPPLSASLPASVAPIALDEAALPNYLKNARARFEAGLLKWLKGDRREGGTWMVHALFGVARSQSSSLQRGFWWAAAALAEGSIDQRGTLDLDLKTLFSRLNQQLKRLADGGGKVAERLFRDVLYVVAHLDTQSVQCAAVREAYGLGELLPAGALEDDAHQLASLQAARELKELVNQAKDNWARIGGGGADKLPSFKQQLGELSRRSAGLDIAALKGLAETLEQVVATLNDTPAEGQALEIATALLLIENALVVFPERSTDFPAQAAAMQARLTQADTGAPEVNLLDEVSRRAQERLLMAQVAQEIQANLGQIEQTLDDFFRDPSTRGELPATDATIRQIRGALTILDERDALAILDACAEVVRRCQAADYEAPAEELEFLAEAFSSLGFYVDALRREEADRDKLIAPWLHKIRGDQPAQDAETEAPSEAEQIVAEFAVGPDAEAARPATQPAPAAAAEAAPEPVAEAPAKPEPVSEAAVDAELLEVYLEEAVEVLDNINGYHQVIQEQPGDKEALTVIRRGFHTLKGSGRMVGLNQLGEVAWAVEQVMNKWLQDEKRATPALVRLVGDTSAAFSVWVGQLKDSGTAQVEASALFELAEQLKSGIEPEVAPKAHAEAAEPAPVETTADEAVAAVEPVADLAFDLELPEVESEAAPQLATEPTLSLDDAAPATGATELTLDAGFELDIASPEAAEPAADVPATDALELEFDLDLAAPEAPASEAVVAEAAVPTLDFDLDLADDLAADAAPAEAVTLEAASIEAEPVLEATPLEPLPESQAVEAALDDGPGLRPGDIEPVKPEPEIEPSELVIGDTVVSKALFGIFLDEAYKHFATLNDAFIDFHSRGEVRPEFVHAAHTLCGIANTTGFTTLGELGYAIEQALVAFQKAGVEPQVGDRDTLSLAIDKVGTMLGSIGYYAPPQPEPQLVALLGALTNRLKDGLQVALPESAPLGTARTEAIDEVHEPEPFPDCSLATEPAIEAAAEAPAEIDLVLDEPVADLDVLSLEPLSADGAADALPDADALEAELAIELGITEPEAAAEPAAEPALLLDLDAESPASAETLAVEAESELLSIDLDLDAPAEAVPEAQSTDFVLDLDAPVAPTLDATTADAEPEAFFSLDLDAPAEASADAIAVDAASEAQASVEPVIDLDAALDLDVLGEATAAAIDDAADQVAVESAVIDLAEPAVAGLLVHDEAAPLEAPTLDFAVAEEARAETLDLDADLDAAETTEAAAITLDMPEEEPAVGVLDDVVPLDTDVIDLSAGDFAIETAEAPVAADELVIDLAEPSVEFDLTETQATEPAVLDLLAETPVEVELAPVDEAIVVEASEPDFDLDLAAPLEAEPVAAEPIAAEAVPTSAAEPDGIGSVLHLATEDRLAEIAVKDELDEQLLPIFIEEAQELTPQVAAGLRGLRADAHNVETLDSLKRVLHTLKGSARMAGAMRLGEATHNMETRLLNAGDHLPAALLDQLDLDLDAINELYDRLVNGEPAEAEAVEPALAAPVAAGEAVPAAAAQPARAAAPAQQQALGLSDPEARGSVRVRADLIDRLVNQAGEVSISRTRIESEMLSLKRSLLDLTDNVGRLRGQLREIEIQAESQMQSRLAQASDRPDFDPLEFDRFSRLQELTRFMAESVNDVATVQHNLLKNLDESAAALTQQARMTRDLQQELMRVRMVPFSSVSERLYRLVRQTGKETGKKVNLEIRGGRVEIDRSVLEKMVSPFEHMLRNAIDHGLEKPEARLGSGKNEFGEIVVEARQEGNELVLVLRDDGAGLDLARIRRKAVEQGLIDANGEYADAQIMALIFEAGFSTASAVTQLSGRGIGMDVVKSEIESLGGRVDVMSIAGSGTIFTIHLPLTLAVTQTVMIKVGAKTYAIPSVMVEQVQELKLPVLEKLYQSHQVEWLGNAYPFHYLPRLLGDYDSQPEQKRYNTVVLLRSGIHRVALHVDELMKNQEVVVKNIGPQLVRVAGVAGATVLGNGEIVLILNPLALLQRRAEAPVADFDAAMAASKPVPEELLQVAPVVMVVDDSLTVRKITGRLLAREGYQVETAKDGVDALQKLHDIRPAVMLLDVEMPRMDGFELTRNLRANADTRDIPIIMITSRTADKHKNYAFELGVNVFLGKPYQEDELLEHIRKLIGEEMPIA
ncbi:hybrid sensor histidine kinase/response regulator [Chitinimonas koreensis]|uniref:hybrid sensor histidine kinase/response regulator n=1 Tax=Chitinimonas koreensis TaxID=356302 RepID=UPI00041425DB|nr:Hpt domain-containing protein [Chitinimonas koreensis]QNM96492.1 Hpt domain-containing protein [Chitinimonas koreensis]